MFDVRNVFSVAVLVAVCGTANGAHAHFTLLSPASWLKEDDGGNPQKGGPCGPTAADEPVQTSGAVTTFHGGEEIDVTWKDTVAHPGHFRIALAENRGDLKDPAIEQDSFCSYDENAVPMGAHDNVLADGVSFRTRTGFSAQAGTMFSAKVTLPNTPCEKCTLQVMQVMEMDIQSISNCYYFHCADIKILPAENGGLAGASGSTAGTGAGGAGGAMNVAGATAGAGGIAASGTGGAGGTTASVTAGARAATAGTTAGAGAGGMAANAAAGGMSSSAPGAAGSVGGAAGAATGSMTNAATTAPAQDSSGCSVSRIGGHEKAASNIFVWLVASVSMLACRRRRRTLDRSNH